MEIRRLDNGLFEANTWLVAENGLCTVIDCGSPVPDILAAASAMEARITDIVLTHGHVDHVWTLEALKAATHARISLHSQERALLLDADMNCFSDVGASLSDTFPMPDQYLSDGETLETGGPSFLILHTPGHTDGCICLLTGKHLFTGDTLFRRSVGRTDLPTGNADLLFRSIRERLYPLAPDTVVHPGHGADTTIDEERRLNPHVRA